jgi:hypothetical protein
MRSFKTAEELWSFAAWIVNNVQKGDVWFCTSLQAQTMTKIDKNTGQPILNKDGTPKAFGLRNVQNTLGSKAVFLDVDVKEGAYTTVQDALRAILTFCKQWKLPDPTALVASGNGVHAYWISDRMLPLDEWRWYAERLRAAAVQAGLKFDGGVTVDPVRILRLPETFNHKSDPPKPVKLLHLADADVTFDAVLRPALDNVSPIAVTGNNNVQPIAPAAPLFDPKLFPRSALAEQFVGKTFETGGEGIKKEAPPLDWKAILGKDGCRWLHEALVSGGSKHDQPQWHLMNLCATFAGDKGRQMAHGLGNKHKGYNPADTDAMYDRKVADQKRMNLGWPACSSIEGAGSKECAGCPFRGNIRSPFELGLGRAMTFAPAPNAAARTEPPSFVDPYADFVGPPFPLDVLPPTLRQFVEAEHRAMGADPSALAMAALTTVAGAIHAETCVRVGDAWWERPIVWTALIGDPSTLKSPILDKATKPLIEIDKQRHQNWQQQYGQWKLLPGKANKKPPPPPKPAVCVVMDGTPEKIVEFLSRGPSGSLMVHDELAGWLDGFDRYSAGASSRAFYLQCWKGGYFRKDRVGKGRQDLDAEIVVDNLALCILGGIQPDRLAKINNLTDDGLLQRILPVLMGPAKPADLSYPVVKIEKKYDQIIKSINSVPQQKLSFDEEAQVVLQGMLDYLYKLEQVNGFSSALISAIGKLKGYYARLCLVLHIARQHDPDASIRPPQLPPCFTPEARERLRKFLGEDKWDRMRAETTKAIASLPSPGSAISCETAEAAERLVREFLLPHTFGLYDFVINGGKDRETLRAVANFVLATKKDRLTPSDFVEGVRALRGAAPRDIVEWAGRFCALGWLYVRPEDEKYPTPKAWTVAPGLRDHFAARLRQAQAARAEAHEILRRGSSRPRATVPDKSA